MNGHSLRFTVLVCCGMILSGGASFAQPYQPQVIWDRSGETDSSAYGGEILPLGDQNDDGYADWAVQSFGNIGTSYHGSRRPYLEFFHGGPSLDTIPHYTFRQDSPAYYQWWHVGTVGDVNGDGYKDWMTNYWPQGFPNYRIHGLFYGGHAPSDIPDFEWQMSVFTGFYWEDDFDFNGDGYDDLFWVNNEIDEARIYYGGSPLDTLPDWTLHQLPPGLNQIYPSAVGDFNGDGASDFLCYNPNPPFNAAVFLGGANPDTIPAYLWSNMTQPLGGVRSLNGDAPDELLFSAVNGANVHFGGDSLRSVPDAFLNSGAAGQSVSAGDFNHDDYDDLILFAWDCFPNPFGCLTLHLGHPWLYPNPVITIEGDTPPLYLRGIYTAVGLGDVNSDSLDDFAIGVWNDTFGPWRGRCVIVAGDSDLVASGEDVPPMVKDFSVEVYPNPFNSQSRITFTLPREGDARLDLINLIGQRVVTIASGRYSPGEHSITLDSEGLSSGIYFVRVEAGELRVAQKVVVLK